MREVNFSIPNVNKASVNITTTLYDRRALDCTSTLPLINSLNHLAYLTTSSARIRDILTVDGGIERLVCILKEGRSKDLMEMWKWSLAFQCVVNIGVRGSEGVRTRVVEADMVPVIATILSNYIKVVDKVRSRNGPSADTEDKENEESSKVAKSRTHTEPSTRSTRSTRSTPASADTQIESHSLAESHHSRRQAPPPTIEIPQPFYQDSQPTDSDAMDVTTSPPRAPMTSPPERSTFGQDAHNHGRFPRAGHSLRSMQPLATAVPTMDTADGFGLRPVRDAERLPSMLPGLQTGIVSQPDSPTTPSGPLHAQPRHLQTAAARQRPSIRQQMSASGESDDANGEDSTMGEDSAMGQPAETIVGLPNRMELDDADENETTMIDDMSTTHDLTVTDPSEEGGQEVETFNIARRSVDGSIINNETTQANGGLGLSPAQATNNPNSPTLAPSPYALYLRDRSAPATQGVLTTMPRDEDVLMSLQLLAYVSKYCNLREYFQSSHLVPKLKIDRELHLLDENADLSSPVEIEEEEEYLLPEDLNIFPLVEKFTVRHHSKDMQYWACVVMRNLCRKDEARGGIRQCAYYKCGKWEVFQRQFAKCRRCRRTKYCSKDCQKSAWFYHRHWCHTTP